MGEGQEGGLKLHFDSHIRLEFRGAEVTSDAGLLAVRELDEVFGLTETAGEKIRDNRTGRNVQHELAGLLRQSVYARLAGYKDVNDHSADGWRKFLEPMVDRYRDMEKKLYFRGDAAFASPRVYEYLEDERILYAVRIPANQNLQR